MASKPHTQNYQISINFNGLFAIHCVISRYLIRKPMRRHKLISEIYKHAEVINANKTTLVFLIATMTDKALTKFHKEFMEKKPYNGL